MITLNDYIAAITYQQDTEETPTKSISTLLQAKGLLAHIESEQRSLKGNDLGREVDNISQLIKKSIETNHELERAFTHADPTTSTSLKECFLNQEKAIEIYYSILRLLKRLNNTKPIETSQLAIDLSNHSLANRENSH